MQIRRKRRQNIFITISLLIKNLDQKQSQRWNYINLLLFYININSQYFHFHMSNFSIQYNEILTSVNRIRYLQIKQQHCHQRITQNLQSIVKKESKRQDKNGKKDQFQTGVLREYTKSFSKQNLNTHQSTKFILHDQNKQHRPFLPYYHKNSASIKSQNILKQSKTSRNRYLQTKCTDQSQLSQLQKLTNIQPKTSAKTILQQTKSQNYQNLKHLKQYLEQQRQKHQNSSLISAITSKNKILYQRQLAQQSLRNRYFNRLQEIQQQKEQKKIRKKRMTAERYQQMNQIQIEQQQKIEEFQQSLIFQDQIRRVIKDKLEQTILKEKESINIQDEYLFSQKRKDRQLNQSLKQKSQTLTQNYQFEGLLSQQMLQNKNKLIANNSQ